MLHFVCVLSIQSILSYLFFSLRILFHDGFCSGFLQAWSWQLLLCLWSLSECQVSEVHHRWREPLLFGLQGVLWSSSGEPEQELGAHMVCGSCQSTLESWYRGKKWKLKFEMPRICREPTDHTNNCYFFMVVVTSYRRGKKTDVFDYPNLPSSLHPVMHCEKLPVPNPPRWSR